MTDARGRRAHVGPPGVGRLTLVPFAAVVLLGGLNGIAARRILRELEPFGSGVMRFAVAVRGDSCLAGPSARIGRDRLDMRIVDAQSLLEHETAGG
jgi:hypothetical protein